MLFNSLFFIFIFFPLFLALYFLVPAKLKNLMLLIASLAFYSFGEGLYTLILIASIFIDYYAAHIVYKGHRTLGLSLSMVFNLGLLLLFKYFNFTLENLNLLLEAFSLSDWKIQSGLPLLLPLGISFFTFQTMSYTLDVYFKKIKPSENLLDFAAYVTMFPQLIAGPIVRYAEVEKYLIKKDISLKNFSDGIERFVIGLAKKVLIANTLAKVVDSIFDTPVMELSTGWCWIGILLYSLQIFYDFSGYTDMAIGMGKMLGFKFPENFNFPYIAKSVREFWRRWHMTLSRWFKDYLYIPLGGSQRSTRRTYINLFIVFVITGLWHGASWNFLIWGLIHGFFIILERLGLQKLLDKLHFSISHIYTLMVVVISWIFFRSSDFDYSISYFKQLFIFSSGDASRLSFLHFYHWNAENIIMFIIGVIAAVPFLKFISGFKGVKILSSNYTNTIYLLKTLFIITLFILCCAHVSTDEYNPFIYFRF